MESIRAEHLRIGNIVNDEDGFPMYIAGFKASKYGYRFIDSAGNTGLVKELSGIPLTPEILLKAGFEQCPLGYGYTHFSVKKYHFEFNEYGCDVMYCNDLNNQNWFRVIACNYIQYTHQIQNLFYSLTGYELIINF